MELKESHMATEIKACRTPLASAHTNQRSLVTSDVLVEVICKKKKEEKLDVEAKSM